MRLTTIFFSLAILLSCSLFTGTAYAQPNKQEKPEDKEARIRALVNSRDYVFHAQTVIPMSGTTRPLTPGYDLRVTRDTIVAFLPYFGRAYSAPPNLSGGGIQFTSTDFEYSFTKGKKDGWNIQIKPKNPQDAEQLTLQVSSDGFAYLQVISLNRQPISFNGYIEQRKKKK